MSKEGKLGTIAPPDGYRNWHVRIWVQYPGARKKRVERITWAEGIGQIRTRAEARRVLERIQAECTERPLHEVVLSYKHTDVPENHVLHRWDTEMLLDRVRLERGRTFGDVWLGFTLWRALRLDKLCEELLPRGREKVPWSVMAAVLVLARLCEPSSELHIAERWYRGTALEDLLGLPGKGVNDDRLYRALDRLLPHKREIERHLMKRLGELFELEYDLLLYDVTSTYFEGLAEAKSELPGSAENTPV